MWLERDGRAVRVTDAREIRKVKYNLAPDLKDPFWIYRIEFGEVFWEFDEESELDEVFDWIMEKLDVQKAP